MLLIADSSPLISLAIIGKLELLDQLFGTAKIAEAVFREITPTDKPFSAELEQWGKPRILRAQNREAVSAFEFLVDTGEAESIVLCKEVGSATLLIDEKKGRKIAELNGLEVIGTVGLLLLAKQKGMIDKLAPLIFQLQHSGVRISANLVATALAIVGES